MNSGTSPEVQNGGTEKHTLIVRMGRYNKNVFLGKL